MNYGSTGVTLSGLTVTIGGINSTTRIDGSGGALRSSAAYRWTSASRRARKMLQISIGR